jgi:molybdopterin molybdotransferase
MLSFEQFIKPALLKMMGHLHKLYRSRGRKPKNENSPFSRIDSFNTEHGGNKDHKRASQVPLKRELSDEGSHLQENNMSCVLPSGHLKIIAK